MSWLVGEEDPKLLAVLKLFRKSPNASNGEVVLVLELSETGEPHI